MAQRAIESNDLEGIVVVSFGGIPTNFTQNVYGFESVLDLADKLGGTPYLLPVPTIIRNSKVREELLKEESIAEVMDYMEKANIAIFTMGDLNRSSYWTQKGFMSDMEWRRIMEKEAVGDVCLHILDREGNICDEEIDQHITALPIYKRSIVSV